MSLEATLTKAWESAKLNWKTRRYLQNYPNDIAAGYFSRTPYYAIFDNLVVGVDDAHVIHSSMNTGIACLAGWSLFYSLGGSLLANGLGDFYKRHSKNIDRTYSAVMTFGFGMAMNLAAGYTVKQSLAASASRAALAFPLGPLTRHYTDAFRNMRDEPPIVMDTQYKDQPASHSIPRAAAMILIPTVLMIGTLALTADKYDKHTQSQQVQTNSR